MRASVRKGDPGYSAAAHKNKIFLDGGELLLCFTADEELGKVWVIVADAEGRAILNKQRTEPLEKCLEGDVRIVLPGPITRYP